MLRHVSPHGPEGRAGAGCRPQARRKGVSRESLFRTREKRRMPYSCAERRACGLVFGAELSCREPLFREVVEFRFCFRREGTFFHRVSDREEGPDSGRSEAGLSGAASGAFFAAGMFFRGTRRKSGGCRRSGFLIPGIFRNGTAASGIFADGGPVFRTRRAAGRRKAPCFS